MNFGKRDLGLVLSESVGDADTLRFTKDASELSGKQELFKPKRDPSRKVHIHRAGQRPSGINDDETVEAPPPRSKKGDSRVALERARAKAGQDGGSRAVREAQVLGSESDSDDSGPVYGGRSDDEADGDVPYRPTAEAADAGQVEEDEDDDAIAARRARIRERLRARPTEQAEVLEVEHEEIAKPEEDSESTEWETDTDASDEEEGDSEQVLKPVFVPKARRETAVERARLEKEEKEREQKRNIEKENRKRETRQLAAQVVRREEEMTENHLGDNESEGDAPDDDDDLDEELAFEEWKVRELSRVRKEKEERESAIKEREDTLRRRNMTDDERRMEDMMLGKHLGKDKGTMKFMQKYYHKGAFYMDDESIKVDDDVRRRSYNAPTLEDKFDKTQMPKPMQARPLFWTNIVKNFGRSGQTKWTHLANEDTTQWDSAWAQEHHVATKMQNKMSGVGNIDAAFKRRKKTSE
ncbi:unnamed protein product [Scytosiphon promiscuus]